MATSPRPLIRRNKPHSEFPTLFPSVFGMLRSVFQTSPATLEKRCTTTKQHYRLRDSLALCWWFTFVLVPFPQGGNFHAHGNDETKTTFVVLMMVIVSVDTAHDPMIFRSQMKYLWLRENAEIMGMQGTNDSAPNWSSRHAPGSLEMYTAYRPKCLSN